jgi:hypothetical protein
MTNLEQLAEHLAKTWGTTTLANFRERAVKEANGTVFEAIRLPNGKRMALIICVTNPAQIKLLEKAFALVSAGPPADWASLTLGELMMRTAKGGLVYEDLRTATGERSAVVLSAAGPDSIDILSAAFELPA